MSHVASSSHACPVLSCRIKCSPSSRKRARPDFLPTMLAMSGRCCFDGMVCVGWQSGSSSSSSSSSTAAAGGAYTDSWVCSGWYQKGDGVNGDGDEHSRTRAGDLALEPMNSHVLMSIALQVCGLVALRLLCFGQLAVGHETLAAASQPTRARPPTSALRPRCHSKTTTTFSSTTSSILLLL